MAATGQSLKGGYHLKKLLNENGWKILDRSDNGSGTGNAWCESGNIDHEGHDRGWRMTRHVDNLLGETRDRIASLLAAGWKSVRVVTDHGWLLLPGCLPNLELSSDLTDNKWCRCAAIKPGATTKERPFPWFWSPNQFFVLADGVSCFRKGYEYAHGGLSLQECLMLELTTTEGASATSAASVELTDVVWRGLRCTVAVGGRFAGLFLDVRTQPGDPSTSAVASIKPLNDNGKATVIIEDEDLEGQDATIILLDQQGRLVAQVNTLIGGGKK